MLNWLLGRIDDVSEEEYAEAYAMLCASRKAHIDRIKNEQAKKCSLLATLLLHRLLAPYGLTGNAVELDEKGRPYIEGDKFFVSISHSDGAVACAVSTEPVGIDIEKLHSVERKLIAYVCTPPEREYVLKEPADVDKRFFGVWTAKEASFKKDGGTGDLRSIDTLKLKKQAFVTENYYITIV